jgi:hypothetical protein
MSHEYHHAVDDARLDAAARAVLRQSLREPPAPLRDVAARVVADTFCHCVTAAEDASEGRFSAIHTALIDEVVRRGRTVIPEPVSQTDSPDPVDVASDQSFPASDPPAWIWQSRRD